MTRTPIGTLATALRGVRLPLASYYAVTVLVPLANGSGNTGSVFLEHMTFVLLAPLALVALVALCSHAICKAALTFATFRREARESSPYAIRRNAQWRARVPAVSVQRSAAK